MPAPVKAQDYPTKTVTLVVPYPPGGGLDVLTRLVAERLRSVIGQPVIVDNRVGGSGLVGIRSTFRSAPDGYTLPLGHTGSISINPFLHAKTGFDPRKDSTPIQPVRLHAGGAARAIPNFAFFIASVRIAPCHHFDAVAGISDAS